MRIVVVGGGRVGLVAAGGLADAGHTVVCAECEPGRLRLLQGGSVPFHEPGLNDLLRRGMASGHLTFVPDLDAVPPADAVLITVGTPLGPQGRADLSQVQRALRQVVAWAVQPFVLIMKSTVPPGTGRRIQDEMLSRAPVPVAYVACPEFLREGCAVEDWFRPYRTVLGADDPRAFEAARSVFAGIPGPVFEMDVTTAEMVKYAANAFLATKVSFINEIANLCDAVGADVEVVAAAMGADPRIGSQYLRPGVGYGGSCFPKDTHALDALSDDVGYRFRLLKAVIEVNADQARLAVERVAQALGSRLPGGIVAVLGVAFKPGTDDVRGSPALDIIGALRERGAAVRAYDPLAAAAAARALGREVAVSRDAYEVCRGANAVMVLTAWPEIIALDWARIRREMAPPYVVYDGRNCLPAAIAAYGLVHRQVGRSAAGAPVPSVPLGAKSR